MVNSKFSVAKSTFFQIILTHWPWQYYKGIFFCELFLNNHSSELRTWFLIADLLLYLSFLFFQRSLLKKPTTDIVENSVCKIQDTLFFCPCFESKQNTFQFFPMYCISIVMEAAGMSSYQIWWKSVNKLS